VSYGKESRSYDGVSINAINTIFYPELYSSRLPYHDIEKVTLSQAKGIYTITTNASGNAYVSICPQSIFGAVGSSDSMLTVFNDNTLNLTTGA